MTISTAHTAGARPSYCIWVEADADNVAILLDGEIGVDTRVPPDTARDLARSLLAAADIAEAAGKSIQVKEALRQRDLTIDRVLQNLRNHAVRNNLTPLQLEGFMNVGFAAHSLLCADRTVMADGAD